MNDIYGFQVTNVAGQGFKRWFNSETTRTSFRADGELPDDLERLCNAQNTMQFRKAFDYCKIRSNALGLDFDTLTEDDWGISPLRKLWRKLRKKQ